MSEEAENVIDTDEDKSSGEESQSSSISSQQIQHSWVFVEKDQVDEVDMPKDSSGDDKCNCLPDSPCANDCPENYEETQHPEVPSLSVPIQTGLLRVDATGTLESCAVIEHRESDSDIEVVERANNIESLSLSSLDEILPRTYQRLLIDILNSRQRHSSEEREGERGTPESSSHQESDELEALEDDIDPGSTDLPANLSVIQPEKKYVHHRNAKLNLLLNVVVAITIALVLGLGVGHFLGWSSQWSHYTQIQTAQTQRLRTLQDELVTCKIDLDDDHDQDDRIIAKLASENEALWTSVRSLQREVSSLSEESSQKVISLKEEMNRLLRENDELRAAVAGLQDNPQRFKTVMSAQSMSSLMLSPEPCEIVSDVPSSRSASGLDAASCSNQDFSTFKDLQFHSPDLPLVKDENSELFIEEGIGPDTHWIYALLQREEQNPEKESLHSLSNFPSWENTTSDILVVNGEKPAANIPQSQSNGHDDEKLFQSSSADRLHYKNLPQVKGRYTADEESVQEEKPEDEWKHPKGVEEEFNHQIEILEKLLVLELNQVEKWHSLVSQCQHRSSSMTPGFSFICRYLDHLLTSFTKISSDKHGDSSEEQQFNDDLTRRSEGKSKHNFRLLHSWLDSWGMDPRKFMAASHDFVKEVQHASKDLLKLAEEKVVMTAHSMNRFGRSVWEKNRKPLKDILQEFGKQVQTIGGLVGKQWQRLFQESQSDPSGDGESDESFFTEGHSSETLKKWEEHYQTWWEDRSQSREEQREKEGQENWFIELGRARKNLRGPEQRPKDPNGRPRLQMEDFDDDDDDDDDDNDGEDDLEKLMQKQDWRMSEDCFHCQEEEKCSKHCKGFRNDKHRHRVWKDLHKKRTHEQAKKWRKREKRNEKKQKKNRKLKEQKHD